MALFTLTSDLGISDYYVAAVKGKILQNCPGSEIYDISNQLRTYDIRQAAFVLRNAYTHFPKGTIHLINVDSDKERTEKYILVEADGYFLLGPDNGLLSLVVEKVDNIILLEEINDNITTFPLLDIISTYACKLANGSKPTSLGTSASQMVQAETLQPVIYENSIKGIIVFIDYYGNAIVNVRKTDFERVGEGKRFIIQLRRNESIREISRTYADVPEGEKVCLFNNAGYMELALNKARLNTLMGMKAGDSILINFES